MNDLARSGGESAAGVPCLSSTALLPTGGATYHSCDFDFYQHVEEMKGFVFPAIAPATEGEVAVERPNQHWDVFYDQHKSGNVYKPRRYIEPEFRRWLRRIDEQGGVVVEVGCGHGCTVLPLFDSLPHTSFFLTDYSVNALRLLLNNNQTLRARMWKHIHGTGGSASGGVVDCIFQASLDTGLPGNCRLSDEHAARVSGCAVWDVTTPFTSSVPGFRGADPSALFDGLLCVFVLSAVPPAGHVQALRHMRACLRPGGVVLFRDYAEADMTMFRHRVRLGERLFLRQGQRTGKGQINGEGQEGGEGTLVYYFSEAYLRALAAEAGLWVEELQYATVINRNRKASNGQGPEGGAAASAKEMKRVFLHGVFSVPADVAQRSNL